MVYLQKERKCVTTLKCKTFFQTYIRRDWNKCSYRWLLLVIAASLILSFAIEAFARRSVVLTVQFIAKHPLVFLYNYLIILFTLSLPLLFRRRVFGLAIVSLTWFGIALANFISQTFRSMPLTASDIWIMSSVRDVISKYLSPAILLLLMLGISVLLGALIFFWMHTKKMRAMPSFAAAHIVLFGGLLLLLGSRLISVGLLSEPEDFGNLPTAYGENGFTYGFSASLVTSGIDKPRGYSRATVEALLEEQNEALPSDSGEKPNLIFVQLESFFDAECMLGLTYAENPAPNFQALKKTATTGLLSAPCIGAGTANTEFEVLTGMNLCHFGVGEYPYVSIVDSNAGDSLAQTLAKVGYSTHAIHNNNATFYRRDIVYANLGFDTFTSLEYMQDVEYNVRDWAKDEVLTGEILQALQSTENRDFVFAVSVQPHGKYPKEPLEDTPTIAVEGMDDEERAVGFAYYLGQLQECDRFVGELIEAFSQFDEPTVVVLYGDHLPSFNIRPSELSYGDSQSTEYVIWANYDIPKADKNLQSYQLGAYALKLAGLYEGNIFRCHQFFDFAGDTDKIYQNALKLLEYDVISGKQYGYASPVTASEITFGTAKIDVTGVSAFGQMTAVRGTNFTPFSVVYLNGTPMETQFLSADMLLVEAALPESGEEIVVAQVSASDASDILSETAPYRIE